MSKKPETVFKERIYPQLLALPSSFWEKIQQVGKRGTPDFLGCVNGVFVALELKKDEKEKPDELQTYKLMRIRKAKGVTFVVTPENWQDVYLKLLKLSSQEIVLELGVRKPEKLQ